MDPHGNIGNGCLGHQEHLKVPGRTNGQRLRNPEKPTQDMVKFFQEMPRFPPGSIASPLPQQIIALANLCLRGSWLPQVSSEKKHGYLLYVGDYTTQLYRDCYYKPF